MIDSEVMCDLINCVKEASPGTFVKYYEGFLLLNRTKDKKVLAATAYILYEEGLVLLVSKKIRDDHYHYYAIRTKKDFNISEKRLISKITRKVLKGD